MSGVDRCQTGPSLGAERKVVTATVAGITGMALLATVGPVVHGQVIQPSVRVNINYVELPIRVLDAKGRFVPDLHQDDFQILENGESQVITGFTVVDLVTQPAESTESSALPRPSDAIKSSAPSDVDGRIFVLLLDDYHIRPDFASKARAVVRMFVRDQVKPHDVVGVVFTSGLRGQDLTRDQALVLTALDRLHGSVDANEPASIREMKALSVVHTIGDVSRSLATIQRRHKAVILITSGVGCVAAADVSQPGSRAIKCGAGLTEAVSAATQSDATIYSLDPAGVTNPVWLSPSNEGRSAMSATGTGRLASAGAFDAMRLIADDTGGFTVSGTDRFKEAFDRIVRDSSAYYLIGYYSTNDRADGSVRSITVRVTRPGLKLFYREHYTAPQ